MSRSSLWRVVFVFVLVVVLAAPAARAAGRAPAEGARTPWDFLGQVWGLLEHIWAEHGCVIDPNGRCLPDPGTSSLTGDNGCILDPDGRCIG